MPFPLDTVKLAKDLRDARDDLNDAVACASQGDLFGAGAHFRAALIKLETIGD